MHNTSMTFFNQRCNIPTLLDTRDWDLTESHLASQQSGSIVEM